ncbi:hypothetical protein [Streptomyces sp. MH60]|uniref:hypothetical protein n=1 Tax=Streptomyces sp. MH60 TaxID=1940758 RepID=UPI000CEDC400|nr:hypothetical protein [Streptomyces sp. MH60]PPS89444.1 hypothetical protein BZZ08_01590 [Streptomyces sp. MH60]
MADDFYRCADREGEGWIRNGPGGTYTTYPDVGLGQLTRQELEEQRGPLRPVGAMTSEDSQALSEAIAKAGKKGFATLLVALYRTARNLMDDGATTAVFTAGRPGSWEAALLRSIIWKGEDISTSRVDEEALEVAQALLYKWTTGPVQVELADGLASILHSAAQKAGGWPAITDRWLARDGQLERWTSAYRIQP